LFTNAGLVSKTKHNLILARKLVEYCFKKISFCYVFVLIIVILNIYISQGSVGTQLRCGEIFNNYFIANCAQSVPVKKF